MNQERVRLAGFTAANLNAEIPGGISAWIDILEFWGLRLHKKSSKCMNARYLELVTQNKVYILD